MTRPARIQKVMATWRRKPDPRRAANHLAFIRQLPCIACGREPPCQAAHIRSSGDAGIGMKPADRFVVGLCAACHHDQHQRGELAFWSGLGIDPLDAASRLWTVSGDLDAGRRVVFRARQAIELRG